MNFNFPVIISPKSHISKQSIISQGTIIHHFAMVNIKGKD